MAPIIRLMCMFYVFLAVTQADDSLKPNRIVQRPMGVQKSQTLTKRHSFLTPEAYLKAQVRLHSRLPDCTPETGEIWETDDQGFPLDLVRCATLGNGAFGSVYSAKNILTNEMVAVKIFDQPGLIPGELQSEIETEVENVYHLKQLRAELQGGKHRVIVMPYVRGRQLAFFFPTFTPDGLKETLRRLARNVMASLLQQGFIHNDLHGFNVLVSKIDENLLPSDEKGAMTAIDFGIGRAVNKTDLKNDVFESIFNVLRYTFYKCLPGSAYYYPGLKWTPLIKKIHAARDLALMMYLEVKEGCPECTIPEAQFVPDWFLPSLRASTCTPELS